MSDKIGCALSFRGLCNWKVMVNPVSSFDVRRGWGGEGKK
jgi:hypothetical protein